MTVEIDAQYRQLREECGVLDSSDRGKLLLKGPESALLLLQGPRVGATAGRVHSSLVDEPRSCAESASEAAERGGQDDGLPGDVGGVEINGRLDHPVVVAGRVVQSLPGRPRPASGLDSEESGAASVRIEADLVVVRVVALQGGVPVGARHRDLQRRVRELGGR